MAVAATHGGREGFARDELIPSRGQHDDPKEGRTWRLALVRGFRGPFEEISCLLERGERTPESPI